MKVGIIGKGKMGMDILFYLLNFDLSFVLIIRYEEDIEEVFSTINKTLKKQLRNGIMDESTYRNKIESVCVGIDLNLLADVELIIETVSEDIQIKQEIFRKLNSIVSTTCILSSNTSSISLNEIFVHCDNKSRCIGIHFFYPNKISKYIEINTTENTSKQCLDYSVNFVKEIQKKHIIFKGRDNMFLTYCIINSIAYANYIAKENWLTINEYEELIRAELNYMGLFSICDGINNQILVRTLKNNMNERNQNAYHTMLKDLDIILCNNPTVEGKYYTRNLGETIDGQMKKDNLKNYKQFVILRLESILVFEIVMMSQGDYSRFIEIGDALKDVMGLHTSIGEMIEHHGLETISNCLKQNFSLYNNKLLLFYETANKLI